MSESVTRVLASYVSSARDIDLPSRLFDRAKELLIDHLGVSLGAIDLPWCHAICRRAAADGGPAESTIYGGIKVAARNAALANATIAHAIELDDTHIPSVSHISAVVFPAALAVAEARGLDGRQFLTAYILGSEAMGRVGRAAGQALLNRGFHPTSTHGVFGAAAAASWLLNLDTDHVESAFGLALSMASGSMQFALETEGTTVKRLHAGLPAERGILAALLAADDFAGPARSIEGERGYLAIFAGHSNAGPVIENLGHEFMIDDMTIKLNACCLHFASLVDAINECVEQRPDLAKSVETIEVFGPRALLNGHMEYRPRSVMAAQYSLPFVTAATLLLDPRAPSSFDDAAMSRSDLLALSDRVKASDDSALQALFPAKFPARVRARFKDGSVVESTVEDARGTPARPVTLSDMQSKFRVLTSGHLTSAMQDNILDAILRIDKPGGLQKLTAMLAAQV